MENFGNLPDQIPPLSNNNATSLYIYIYIYIIITVEYLKMTARSRSNKSGAELGHLVKVSKIPFQYILGFLKTGLVKISCFLRQKA